MTKSIPLILMVAVFSIVSANDKDSTDSRFATITKGKFSNYFGGAVGGASGLGLSYRRWTSDKNGFEITLLPVYREYTFPEDDYIYTQIDSGYGTEAYISAGALYLRKIMDSNLFRVVTYGSGNVFYSEEIFDFYYKHIIVDSVGTQHKYTFHNDRATKRTSLTLGTGLGCEFYFWRLALSLMGGLKGGYTFETNDIAVQPTFECGLYFRL